MCAREYRGLWRPLELELQVIVRHMRVTELRSSTRTVYTRSTSQAPVLFFKCFSYYILTHYLINYMCVCASVCMLWC